MPAELDKAIRLADETIRMHGATKLSDLIDISAPKLTCQECNCTYGYTPRCRLGMWSIPSTSSSALSSQSR